MPEYAYQPQLEALSFEAAFDVLSQKFPGRVRVGGVAHVDVPVVAGIVAQFASQGIRVNPFHLQAAEYEAFCQKADYTGRYPQYYCGNLPEKSLEHFVATRLLEPSLQDTFVDLASEHSPLPEIVHRLFGSRAYAQDLMYPPGVHGDNIGGDACAMPVADAFISKAALTCSLEHFEGDGDIRLFQELARVLRPGGRVVVVPLYMFHEPAVQTDPRYSVSADVPFDPEAVIYCARGWCNRHGRFYSAETLIERILRYRNLFTFTIYRLEGFEAIPGKIYARFALVAQRI